VDEPLANRVRSGRKQPYRARFGLLVSLPPHTADVTRIERSEMRGQPTRSYADPDFAPLDPGYLGPG
jgi:hypothetical protein